MNGWSLRLRLRASARFVRILPFEDERFCDRRFELLQTICASEGSRCRKAFRLRTVPLAMVSLPVLSLLVAVVAGKEGRLAQAQAHSGFVVKVKAPKEADAEVLASLDGLMRSAQGERAAADAEFAASKSKMLAAERAEVQRIVRGSRR